MSSLILIVDDEPDLRDAVGMILESAGYRVVRAANGPEALSCLDAHTVDLVIADIAMPEMNGYQLLERVREHPKWTHIPFVFLSARALDSDVRFGKSLGVDDYLVKPVHTTDLLATVEGRLLRARQLRRAYQPAGTSEVSISPIPAWQHFGRLAIEPHSHKVQVDDQDISLSAREFRLLVRLAAQPGETIELADLAAATHGLEAGNADAGMLLRPLIRSVRRKFGFNAGDMGCIENVRGVGYRLLPLR